MSDERIVQCVGIPWYQREQWDRLKHTLQDADVLPHSYDDWFEQAQGQLESLEAEGMLPVKAYIDPDTFPAFCCARGLKIDAAARNEFANRVAYQEYVSRYRKAG